MAKPCSIGLVTYTATTKAESTVSKQTNERRRKGYEITRPVVTTSVRRNPNEQKNEDNKGYAFTRPVVKTAGRRNPKE